MRWIRCTIFKSDADFQKDIGISMNRALTKDMQLEEALEVIDRLKQNVIRIYEHEQEGY